MSSGVRHLYVHMPFCVHRCGYCDFVTAVGRQEQHGAYVDAVLAELALEGGRLAEPLDTVYVGGGTPTFTEHGALSRLLESLPTAEELTVEANPETVTPELVRLLTERGINRVSLGAQTFRPALLSVLERQAGPDDVRRAVHTLRDASFDNISLDLLYGIPGQSSADLDADIEQALMLGPEHMSWYELEAKPGTRFTHRFGTELARQADAMEGYFERVVGRLTRAGYRWYETANFALSPARDGGSRDLRSRHNLAYWHGRDYLGVGVGAVSTVTGARWRNGPRLPAYIAALARTEAPPRELEPLPHEVQLRERVMLGLRLDEPLPLAEVGPAIDPRALERLEGLELVETSASTVRLTPRGRRLGGGVTAELLAYTES
ncbi:MAG TPA: radical SAM family heme chaperone HemW [Gaiellaceae bacterium]|nr:radical SAM family heme chaperone HemW [Gaiellaceae bacterium]